MVMTGDEIGSRPGEKAESEEKQNFEGEDGQLWQFDEQTRTLRKATIRAAATP